MPIIRSFLIYVGVTFWVILGYNRKARALLKQLLERQRNNDSAPHRIVATIEELVGLGPVEDDEQCEVITLIREALGLLESTGEGETYRVAYLLATLGSSEEKSGNDTAAIEAYERTLRICEREWGSTCILIDVLRALARLYIKNGANVDQVQEFRARADKVESEYWQRLFMSMPYGPPGPP